MQRVSDTPWYINKKIIKTAIQSLYKILSQGIDTEQFLRSKQKGNGKTFFSVTKKAENIYRSFQTNPRDTRLCSNSTRYEFSTLLQHSLPSIRVKKDNIGLHVYIARNRCTVNKQRVQKKILRTMNTNIWAATNAAHFKAQSFVIVGKFFPGNPLRLHILRRDQSNLNYFFKFSLHLLYWFLSSLLLPVGCRK